MGAAAASGLFFLGICLLVSSFILVSVRIYQINASFVFKILRYILLLSFWMVFCIAAVAIGLKIDSRHNESYSRSLESVNKIWGGYVTQEPPSLIYEADGFREYENKTTGKLVTQSTIVEKGLAFEEQNLNLKLVKNIRKKGLLTFPGYNLEFEALYVFSNKNSDAEKIEFRFSLPTQAGNITNIEVEINGKPYKEDINFADGIQWRGVLAKDEFKKLKIKYKAQGTKSFYYNLGVMQTEIKKFAAKLETDYTDFKIPDNSMSVTTETSDSKKSILEWNFQNLVTGQNIAIEVEAEGNYGKIASKLFFYSPLSLFLFLVSVVLFVTVKKIKFHPMNYLFLLASFFTFYLLGSYLISYMNVFLGILISLLVSTGIIYYYGKLLKRDEGLTGNFLYSAFIFQWFFSIAFFFPEHTGLLITVATIFTFIALIRFTADTDWEDKF